MPRASANADLVRHGAMVWQALRILPVRLRVGLIALALLGFVVYWVVQHRPAPPVAPGADPMTGLNADGSGTFLFVFWNVENLFDDKDDKRREVDETYDNPFAADADLRQQKLDHIADALLKLNGGKGPDVIACAEVESVRAADLLRGTLNRKLNDPKLAYTQTAMKDLDAGRHIAPCVITRLNVIHAATKMHGTQLRILETRLSVNGYPLTVVASHWTSQLQQRDGSNGDSGRDKYAGTIRRVFDAAVRADVNCDFLVCGDFNCTPDSEPVRDALGTTNTPERFLGPDNRPLLFNLFGDKPADRFGTLFYNGKPLIYDHICVSAGLLDKAGWGCAPESVQTITAGLTRPGATRREPWRFGDPGKPPVGGRGYADHFPVAVTLTVKPPGGAKPRPE